MSSSSSDSPCSDILSKNQNDRKRIREEAEQKLTQYKKIKSDMENTYKKLKQDEYTLSNLKNDLIDLCDTVKSRSSPTCIFHGAVFTAEYQVASILEVDNGYTLQKSYWKTDRSLQFTVDSNARWYWNPSTAVTREIKNNSGSFDIDSLEKNLSSDDSKEMYLVRDTSSYCEEGVEYVGSLIFFRNVIIKSNDPIEVPVSSHILDDCSVQSRGFENV